MLHIVPISIVCLPYKCCGCSCIRFFITGDANSIIQPIGYFMVESCFWCHWLNRAKVKSGCLQIAALYTDKLSSWIDYSTYFALSVIPKKIVAWEIRGLSLNEKNTCGSAEPLLFFFENPTRCPHSAYCFQLYEWAEWMNESGPVRRWILVVYYSHDWLKSLNTSMPL